MAEYIEREVLRKVLSHELVDADTGTPMDFYNMGIRTLRRMVEDIPAADVQTVKHGVWIQLTQNVEPTALKCSLCGEISCCHGMYCPDCGARMDGET